MLYLIGGASRSGKSTLARRLLMERQVPYLSTDILMMGIANGLPQLGLDPNDPDVIVGETLGPLLRAMAVNILETGVTYLLEGATLLPAYVAELIQDHGTGVEACFIGYAAPDATRKLRDIRVFGGGPNDWVRGHTDDQVLALIAEMVDFSTYLRDECTRYHLPYFDNSHDFLGTLDSAFQHLITPAGETHP